MGLHNWQIKIAATDFIFISELKFFLQSFPPSFFNNKVYLPD